MAGLDPVENLLMGQVDPLGVAKRLDLVEGEGLAVLERDLLIREFANAQLGPLQVGENADGPGIFFLQRTDGCVLHLYQVVLGMAHVDAENVGAGNEEFFDQLHAVVGGA